MSFPTGPAGALSPAPATTLRPAAARARLTRRQATALMRDLLRPRSGAGPATAELHPPSLDTIDSALLGCLVDAAQARCSNWTHPDRPVITLPSYGGHPHAPDLGVLLALQLSQQQVTVLVHGTTARTDRASTRDLFTALGLPVAGSAVDAQRWLQGHDPVFIDTDVLCPGLGAWAGADRSIGQRVMVSVASLLRPMEAKSWPGSLLRVVTCTGPAHRELLMGWAAAQCADVLLLTADRGMAVANPLHLVRADVILQGVPQADLARLEQDIGQCERPVLPDGRDTGAVARYVQSVLAGERPCPQGIDEQVRLIAQIASRLRMRLPQPGLPALPDQPE